MANPDIQSLLQEMGAYTTDIKREVWGPSPIVPEPIRRVRNGWEMRD